MSGYKIIEADEPQQPAQTTQPSSAGKGSFVIRDYDEQPRTPSPGAAASVNATNQIQAAQQREAQEREEARLRAEKLGEGGKQALSGFGSAADTLTAGFFPYIPAAMAKGAGYLGVPGYEYAKDMPMMELKKKAQGITQAAEEQYPKTSYAGTAAGIGLGAATLPTFSVGKGAVARGASSGAVYGGLGGLSENLDPTEALKGAGVGAATGAVLSPIVEKGVSKVLSSVNKGLPVGGFEAAKAAGLADEDIARLMPWLKQTMTVRGPTKEAAKEAQFAEFGLTPTRGMVSKSEAQLAKEAQYGAPSYARLQQEAAAAAEKIAGGAQPELRDAITIAVDKAGKNAAALKKQVDAAYETAANAPGKFDLSAISNLGERLRMGWGKNEKLLDFYANDVARNAAKELDGVLGAKIPIEGGSVVHQTFNAVESGRKILNNAYGNAKTNADRAAVRKLVEDFDNHIESAINNGAFSGDKAVLQQWKDARKLYSEYQSKYGVKKTGEESGSLLKSIIEGNKSSDDVANMLFNFSNSGDATMKATAFKTMSQLRRALGPNSPELDQIKNSFVQQMMTPTGDVATQGAKVFTDTAKQINGLLSGKGQGVANRLFTADERQMLQRYAKVMQEAGSGTLTPKEVSKFKQYVAMGTAAGSSIGSAALAYLSYLHPVAATVIGAPGAIYSGYKTVQKIPAVASAAANAPVKGFVPPQGGGAVAVPLGVNQYEPKSSETEINEDVSKAANKDFERRYRWGRKEGGKVVMDHDAEAERLINLAQKTHREHQNETKALLSVDDNTVAKALEVAQSQI